MWSTFEKEFNNVQDTIKIAKNIDLKLVKRKFMFPNNPGVLININRHVTDIYPSYFKGLSLSLYNQNCTLNFNNSVEVYTPFKQFTKLNSPNNAQYRHNLSEQLECTVDAHLEQLDKGALGLTVDYYEKKFTLSAAASHEGLDNGEIAVRFLQNANSKLDAGAEVTLETLNKKVSVNFVARYLDSARKCVYSGYFGMNGLQFCLFKRIDSKLTMASIVDIHKNEPVASLACQYLHKMGKISASVDTRGYCGVNVSFQEFFNQSNLDITTLVCCFTDFRKFVKMGVGFEIKFV